MSAPPEFVQRVLLARNLNQLMHTTRFTAWNVQQIPREDLAFLNDWAYYEDELNGS